MSGLSVRGLRVEIRVPGRRLVPVDGVDLEVGPRECVALLGESGSGKSLTALALMRLLPEAVHVAAGEARLGETDLFALPEEAMRQVRGGRLAMIFQEPMLSLNPVLSVGQQVAESLAAHRGLRGGGAAEEVARLLRAVGLEPGLAASYPFQLSGGQRQRALIATMLAGEPELLIADEPTTALDVTVQAQILRLLKRLQTERGMGLLLITHDLDVARDMADRVAIMYAGQIVEWAPRQALYDAPFHPYTRKLFQVLPSAARGGERLAYIPGGVPALDTDHAGCRFAARCPRAWARCRTEAPGMHALGGGHHVRCHLAVAASPTPDVVNAVADRPETRTALGELLKVEGLAVHFPIRRGVFRRTVGWTKAVDGVSLTLSAGETLAVVGESGCGKTTLARALLRLIEPSAGRLLGSVRLDGEEITTLGREALRRRRADMQIVFQDPFASLDPRMRVGEILEEGLVALRPDQDRADRRRSVADLLGRVGLDEAAALRYPHAFSGGQRQRIAIARALAVAPRLLICDEPTSALDVSIQAQILNLLNDLQDESGLAYLFITHNLPVVGYLAHRVMVMYRGRVVEEAGAAQLFEHPLHPYTGLLLASAPGHGLGQPDRGPGAAERPGGVACPFAQRCPRARQHCLLEPPDLVSRADGRRVACHYPD